MLRSNHCIQNYFDSCNDPCTRYFLRKMYRFSGAAIFPISCFVTCFGSNTKVPIFLHVIDKNDERSWM